MTTKTVTASIAVVPIAVPAGTVAGVFRVNLLNSAGSVLSTQDVIEAVASFSVGAGDYRVAAVRLDVAGEPIGDGVLSDWFTIDADQPVTVMVDVPGAVYVTLT